jgi:hypothetical protein
MKKAWNTNDKKQIPQKKDERIRFLTNEIRATKLPTLSLRKIGPLFPLL